MKFMGITNEELEDSGKIGNPLVNSFLEKCMDSSI